MAPPANGHSGKAGIGLNTPRCCSGPEPVAMATQGGRGTGEAVEPSGPPGTSPLPELGAETPLTFPTPCKDRG